MIKHSERLDNIDDRLARVARLAATGLPFGVLCVEGLRSKERQEELYAQGRTRPGKIVTWTLESKHIEGQAIDIAPLQASGAVDWGNIKAFDQISAAMFAAAEGLGIRIRWGADWDQDGKPRERGESDSPHFELV